MVFRVIDVDNNITNTYMPNLKPNMLTDVC